MSEHPKRLRSRSGTRPSLPSLQNEKSFHVFFWYDQKSQHDVKIIDSIKSKLDAEYNVSEDVVRYFSPDDFIPGQSLLQNYIAGIKNSLKIAILISDSFYKNGMKEYVTQLSLYIRRPKYAVIPILKDRTTILPEILKPLEPETVVYDASSEKWFDEFISLLATKIEISGMLKDVPHLPIGKLYHFSLLCDERDQSFLLKNMIEEMEKKTNTADAPEVTKKEEIDQSPVTKERKIDILKPAHTSIADSKGPITDRNKDVFKYKILEIEISDKSSENILKTIDTLLETIDKSMKFVIFISANFLNNKNCKYFTQLVKMVMQDLRLQGGYIIPVYHDVQCEWFDGLFDTEIQGLNTRQEQWIDRLIDCLARTEVFEQREQIYFTFPRNDETINSHKEKVFRVSEFDCFIESSDSNKPRLLDICILHSADIAVIDAENNKLKRYSFAGIMQKELRLDGMPNRMCHIVDDDVGIIFEYGFEIICIDTNLMTYKQIVIAPYDCIRGLTFIDEKASSFAITTGDGLMEFCLIEKGENEKFTQKIIHINGPLVHRDSTEFKEKRRKTANARRELFSDVKYANAKVCIVEDIETLKASVKIISDEGPDTFSTETKATQPNRRLINMPRRLSYSRDQKLLIIADENDRQLIYFNRDEMSFLTRSKWKGLYNLRGLATVKENIYVAASNGILVYDFKGNNVYGYEEPLIEMTHIVYHTRGVAAHRFESSNYLVVTQATKIKNAKREIVRVFKI